MFSSTLEEAPPSLPPLFLIGRIVSPRNGNREAEGEAGGGGSPWDVSCCEPNNGTFLRAISSALLLVGDSHSCSLPQTRASAIMNFRSAPTCPINPFAYLPRPPPLRRDKRDGLTLSLSPAPPRR